MAVVPPAPTPSNFEPDPVFFTKLASDSPVLAGLENFKGKGTTRAFERLLLSSGRELVTESVSEGEPDSELVSSEDDSESSEAGLGAYM